MNENTTEPVDVFVGYPAREKRSEGALASGEAEGFDPKGADHPDMEALRDEIATLSAHVSAAEFRLLKMIGELDANNGWAIVGAMSCVHWLSYRVGVSNTTAREKVRVARALRKLPKISAAMECGQLSYSKVRSLTRVANEENEDYLLQLAIIGTAWHVDGVVKRFRRCQRLQAEDEAREQNEEQYKSRYVSYHYNNDGMLVLNACLPPEQGAKLIAAIEAAEEELRQGSESNAPAGAPQVPNSDSNGQSEFSVTRAGDSDRVVDAYEIELKESAPAAESHSASTNQSSCSCPTNAPAGALEVPNSDSDGQSEILSLEKPRKERLPYTPVLRADALALVAEQALSNSADAKSGQSRYQVVVHVDAEVLSDPQNEGCCELEKGPALWGDTVRRIACDADRVLMLEDPSGKTLDVGRKTRAIPPAIKRALNNRDPSCRWPGCDRHRYLHAHHIEHWADGGETNIDNVVHLCTRHHHLVHEGGYKIEGNPNESLMFIRPEGTEIPHHFEPPRLPPDPVAALRDTNTGLGFNIDPDTNLPHWSGERIDYNFAVQGLLD